MTLQAVKILIWGWFKDPDEGLEPENWPIGVGGGEGRGEFMARDSKGLQPRTNRLFWEIFWKMFTTMSCFTYLTTAPCHLDSAKLTYTSISDNKPSLHDLISLQLSFLFFPPSPSSFIFSSFSSFSSPLLLLQDPLNPAFSPHCQWSPSLYLQWICKRIPVASYLYF